MTTSRFVVCAHCASVNNVPAERDATLAKCGKCKEPLLTRAPKEVGENVFSKSIAQSDVPVVVDFWAPWCGPCKMMAPQFAEAASRHHGKVQYLKLNTEQEQRIAALYNIRSIPTMAVFHKGKELGRTSGAMDSGRIHQWVESILQSRQ